MSTAGPRSTKIEKNGVFCQKLNSVYSSPCSCCCRNRSRCSLFFSFKSSIPRKTNPYLPPPFSSIHAGRRLSRRREGFEPPEGRSLHGFHRRRPETLAPGIYLLFNFVQNSMIFLSLVLIFQLVTTVFVASWDSSGAHGTFAGLLWRSIYSFQFLISYN